MSTESKPIGRPSTYTPEQASAICELISDGKSLRTICAADNMPSMFTIFNWLHKHEDFAKQYARAKDEQSEAFVEDMQEIADNPTGDVARDRLRLDTRKWIASKLKPKKYGDRIDQNVNVSGSISLNITLGH